MIKRNTEQADFRVKLSSRSYGALNQVLKKF